MPTDIQMNKLTEEFISAVGARDLHEKRGHNYRRLLTFFDLVVFAIAIGFLPVRLVVTDVAMRHIVDVVWEIVAGLLLFLSMVKFFFQWQEGAEQHRVLMAKNVHLASEAELLMHRRDIDERDFEAFVKRANELQEQDRALIKTIADAERQAAYRQGLKEFNSGKGIACPKCKADPWKFAPGACQACGSGPVTI
ncbi:hypothetical protein IV102_22200 [bacterium]|nr:hypothetical protein [bacterium]